MATPDFVLALREHIGTAMLWLSGVTAVVVRDNGDVLCVRRSDNGAWTAVTGIIDPGEEPAVAAEREVLEEAGIVAVAEHLAKIQVINPVVYPNGDRSQYLDIIFRCRYVSGVPYPADGENTEAAWFAPDALPPMSEHHRARIITALAADGPALFVR